MVGWYPTLLKLSGASLEQKLPLDGKDLWPAIAEGKPSPHEEILLNVEPNRGALRRGTGSWSSAASCPGQRTIRGRVGSSCSTSPTTLARRPTWRRSTPRG
jgi:hypothetical protein